MYNCSTRNGSGCAADPLSEQVRGLIATPEDAKQVAVIAVNYLVKFHRAGISAQIGIAPADLDAGCLYSLAHWAVGNRNLEIVQGLLATVVLPEEVAEEG